MILGSSSARSKADATSSRLTLTRKSKRGSGSPPSQDDPVAIGRRAERVQTTGVWLQVDPWHQRSWRSSPRSTSSTRGTPFSNRDLVASQDRLDWARFRTTALKSFPAYQRGRDLLDRKTPRPLGSKPRQGLLAPLDQTPNHRREDELHCQVHLASRAHDRVG